MAKLRRPLPEPPAIPGASADGRPRARPDPRWLLSPEAGRIAAHMYYLMTGTWAPGRIHGWVALAQGEHGEPTAATVWQQHGDVLMAAAEAAGFTPWMVTKKRPKGDGVRAWAQQFLATHQY